MLCRPTLCSTLCYTLVSTLMLCRPTLCSTLVGLQGATGSFAHFEAAYTAACPGGVRLCKLERNYRSTAAIVRVADALQP